MKSMSARDAKNSLGLLLDHARAEPVEVQKHGRPVVVVISVEEFQRLTEALKGKHKGIAALKRASRKID